MAQNDKRPGGSAIDGRTTRHAGYAVSQRKRKRIEECFGWLKTIALMSKVRHRGIFKVGWGFTFAACRSAPAAGSRWVVWQVFRWRRWRHKAVPLTALLWLVIVAVQ